MQRFLKNFRVFLLNIFRVHLMLVGFFGVFDESFNFVFFPFLLLSRVNYASNICFTLLKKQRIRNNEATYGSTHLTIRVNKYG